MSAVAFQGELGAYSEAAVRSAFGGEAAPVPCESFRDVFEALSSGRVERAVVPVENSLHGSVHPTYDLLQQFHPTITGERTLRIRHCLLGPPGATADSVRIVRSHPQALGQCDGYLRRHGYRAEPDYDTAGAAKHVAQLGDPSIAAIAARRAAEVYGLTILDSGIEDAATNFTRFLLLAGQPDDAPNPVGPMKTSLVFTLGDVPGALFKALAVFALRDIDLLKIESRPLRQPTDPRRAAPWPVAFYVDLLADADGEPCRRALDHLRELAPLVRVLGSYPVGPVIDDDHR